MKVKRIIEIEKDIYEDCKRLGVMGSITARVIADSKPYDDSGDLISREALKKIIHKSDLSSNREWLLMDLDKIIDNAPTVHPRDNYDLGYVQGSEDGKPKQGKWIEFCRGIHVTDYKCSCCGRTVRDDTGYDVSKDYPFCHCGAGMRKGGAE